MGASLINRLSTLLRRFGRDEGGAFALVFGLMAIVLIALGGATVDYVTLEQVRNRSQIALDAAALALQPDSQIVGAKTTDIQREAQALVDDRVGGDGVVKILTTTINRTDGKLYFLAEVNTSTTFVALVGVNSMKARIQSEAMRRQSQLEVVMVLDNSGSMNDYFENRNQFRMTNLVNAARNASDILFAGASTTDPNVRIGIVPFTQYVNIGTNNANQPWLNRSGNNPIVRDNFDSDANPTTAFTASFDRINLFGQLAGLYSWGGCVEARQSPYDTNDTPPTSPETRFVPLFVPDEPDTGGFQNSYLNDDPAACTVEPTCTVVWKYNNYSNRNGFTGLISTTATFKPASGGTSTGTSCPAAYDPWVQTGSVSSNTNNNTQTANYVSNRVRQERICKYNGGIVTKASRSQATGPNADCPVNAVLPLTANRTTVTNAIEKMRPVLTLNQPEGGTNIAQGAIWGLHVLSPGLPFSEGAAYDPNVKKVIILMTDGDNFAKPNNNMNGSTFYPAYGYPYNNTTRANAGRLGAPGWTEDQLMSEMDDRTLAACASAKANDIEIFTIGLYSTTSSTIQMLKDCSSGASDHYFPATADNLNSVFESIARQLQPLRITQ